MKNFLHLSKLSLLTLMMIFAACSKKGDPGPTGNANVTVYNYGSVTFTGSTNYTLTNISQGMIDSSLVLAYYNPSTEAATAWYPVPGGGPVGAYEVRYFIHQSAATPSTYTMGVRAQAPAGGPYATPLTFRKFKIIIAPANKVLTGGRQAAPVDYNDYEAVRKYYNLPD